VLGGPKDHLHLGGFCRTLVGVSSSGAIATAVDTANNRQELAATRQRFKKTRTDVLLRVQILFLAVLSGVMLVALVHLAGQVSAPATPSSQPQPRGFVWGGETFVDLKSFARWLRARGYSYETWAQNHRRRAGLPLLPSQQPAQAQEGTPGWLGVVVGAGAIAFVLCCFVIVWRRRRSWGRISGARLAGVSWAERAHFEADWWRAAAGEFRGITQTVAVAASRAAHATVRRVSSERGKLLEFRVDWTRLLRRGAYALRVVRHRANPSQGDAFWYVAATLLAIAMGVVAVRLG
jgi:hypothetical protein